MRSGQENTQVISNADIKDFIRSVSENANKALHNLFVMLNSFQHLNP